MIWLCPSQVFRGAPLLQQIFTIIAPVLVMAFIGFVWVRLRMPFDNNTITDIIINIGAPCLLFSTLLIRRPEPAALAEIAAVAFAMLAIVGVLAAVVLKLARLELRTYWPALVFPNTGNMGLPLCFLAFGDTGLSLAIAFFCAMTILQFTVGQGVASGHMRPSALLRNPILWSIAVALTCLMAELTPPAWIMTTTTDTVGRIVIPLMLMSLGTSLARLRIVTVTRSLALSLFRLALGFGVAFGLVTVLGLEGPVRGVMPGHNQNTAGLAVDAMDDSRAVLPADV